MITSTTVRSSDKENFPCFYREYTGVLEKYGDTQEKYYGKKADLIERLERMYDVKLGRNVRHLCGEIILFFPRRTGLTGQGMAQCQWQGTYFEENFHEDGLTHLTPGIGTEIPTSEYDRLFQAIGLSPEYGGHHYCRKPPHSSQALYIYFFGTLYVATFAKPKYFIRLESVKRKGWL